MTTPNTIEDICILSGLDDVDLQAMRTRLDLLLRTGADAVHAGTEGVSNGFNIASPGNGFRAMVFPHSESVSLWANHSGDVRANASFQMPADDDLREALERGGDGVAMFVDRWLRTMGPNPSRHVPVIDQDPKVRTAILLAGEILDTVISSANPDFPTWNSIEVTHRTSCGGGSVRVGGRQILTSQAEQVVLGALPSIVEMKPHSADRGYCILPYTVTHKFAPKDSVSVLRSMSELGLDLPGRVLRKAGMERRP
jgi:hypothetical protein